MARWALRLVGLGLVLFSALGLWMRGVDHDPSVWHVDPARAERTGKPNDYLVAPEGASSAAPDLTLSLPDPAAALTAFDRAARGAPRVEVVAGSPEDGRITYVQRSAVFGFPDYITVARVDDGLVIWSRARFGYGDMGVNRARVTDWLKAAGLDGT